MESGGVDCGRGEVKKLNCFICLDSGTNPTWKPAWKGSKVYKVDKMVPCGHCQQGKHKFDEDVCICGKKKNV